MPPPGLWPPSAAALLALLALLVADGGAAHQLCSVTGVAEGYACADMSCVGVLASCVGAHAVDCSCGDNKPFLRETAAAQPLECPNPSGQGCGAYAAAWCDRTESCESFAVNGGGFQGFTPRCTPWAETSPEGECVAVPSPGAPPPIATPLPRAAPCRTSRQTLTPPGRPQTGWRTRRCRGRAGGRGSSSGRSRPRWAT